MFALSHASCTWTNRGRDRLKWDKSAAGALAQIKEKRYGSALQDYTGNLLLVGINYDKTAKKHECLIEKVEKR